MSLEMNSVTARNVSPAHHPGLLRVAARHSDSHTDIVFRHGRRPHLCAPVGRRVGDGRRGDPALHNVQGYLALKERLASFGLQIYRLANHRCHNMAQVTLDLPGRDEKIAEYLHYIRDLGAAGIHYSTYAHMANGIWSARRERIRGGAESRAFHIDGPHAAGLGQRGDEGELTHGREYSEAGAVGQL